MTAHTRGPWFAAIAYDPEPVGWEVYSNPETRQIVAKVLPTPEHNAKANARLIAAAPELLQRLEELLNRYEPEGSKHFTPEGADARRAIASAKGE